MANQDHEALMARIRELAQGGTVTEKTASEYTDKNGKTTSRRTIRETRGDVNLQKLEELAIDAIYHGKADWM